MLKKTQLHRCTIAFAIVIASAYVDASESAQHVRPLATADQAIIPGFLKNVSEQNLSRSVYYLAKDPLPFRKTNYTAPGHAQNTLEETDAWLEKQLRAWHYLIEREVCEVHAFGCDLQKPKHHTYTSPPPGAPLYRVCNLYAKKLGRSHPKEIILLVAHKDSQSWNDSPGAYDNAVGTAAILELARVLANYESERSLWFLWCNEEHTPWTSVTAARNSRERGDNFIAIFNTDSLGGKSNEDIAAGRKTNVSLYTTPEGKRLADLMAEMNQAYKIGLAQASVQRSQPGDDDGSFVKAGYSCAIANLGSFPYADTEYHLAGDVAERVDTVNVRMAAQAILAAVLHLD